jgi:UDP-N-acetylglucosamine 3-dehydrogenase
LVDICLPTTLHADYSIAALQNGKHVFCETPIAYSLEDANRMRAAARVSGKLLLVGLFGRFMSDTQYIHDLIESGILGNIKTIYASRRTAPVWGDGWNENFILDLMLHDIDIITWLLGQPQSVTSRAVDNVENGWGHVGISLEYPKANVFIEGCGIMPLSFPFSTTLRTVCEDGAIDLEWRWGDEFPISEIKVYPKVGQPQIPKIDGLDPYETECRYFVDCVKGEADPQLVSLETAIQSLQIALAAKESLQKNGERVYIESNNNTGA